MTMTTHLNDSVWYQMASLAAEGWRERANCRDYPYLPWMSDSIPSGEEEMAMADVCGMCEVREQCAIRALHAKEAGGWWAGVWIPWRGNPAMRNGESWTTARNRLRRLLGIRLPPESRGY